MASMGHALKHLGGQGPIEVLTKMRDFNIQTVENDGKMVTVPADTLVAFTAQSFREVGDSDVWEFQTTVPTPGGPARALIYVRGDDLFMVRCLSKVL